VDSPRRATLPTHTRHPRTVRDLEHGSRQTTPWPVFLLDFTGTELRSPPSGPHNRNVPPPAPAASARSAEKARTPGSPDTGNHGNTRTHKKGGPAPHPDRHTVSTRMRNRTSHNNV
jgi:hypothetical protein